MNNIIIITEPNITTLYVGQLVKVESLPALLEKNFVTIDDIEFIPYSKELHKKYIEIGKEIYNANAQIIYSAIY
jgi:hypothetical protein